MMQPVDDGGTVGRDGSVTPPRDGGGGGGNDGGVTPPNTCTMDSQCNDSVDCTIDTCDTGTHRCRNVRDLTRCACDPSCMQNPVGGGMGPNGGFDMNGQNGVDYDMPSGGLIVRANNRRADYLWIPNTGESTVSKWDANTRREIARYRVGLASGECVGQCCWTNNCNMTSRTVVDGFGNAWIANRGFTMQGTVSKIAAENFDCVDRNMNGMIDTSTGPMDVKPYGQDECVLFNAPVGPANSVLRAIAIDRGDENFPEGYVWVGSCNGSGPATGWQLNPRTGAVLNTVALPHCAYGAVVTPDGRLWWNGGAFATSFTAMNTTTRALEATVSGGGYGITVDADGRLWFSNANRAYDTRSRQWTTLPMTVNSRGITVDPMNRVWGVNGNNLVNWDAAAFVAGGSMPAAAFTSRAMTPAITASSALGADRAGNIWVATYNTGPLWLFDTATNTFSTHNGPNRVYTYTDFTGAVRRLVIGTGTYDQRYTAACNDPQMAELTWDASLPAGTSLQFTLRTAATEAGLGMATPVVLANTNMDMSPVQVGPKLAAAMVTAQKYMRLTITFNPSRMPVASPVLRTFGLSWRCSVNPG
ncbi:MAG: hypothetical protein U0269_11605 [Polyangiales bacterium]